MIEPDKLYTVTEVCDILQRNKRTVYNYIRSGQLRAFRPGKKNLIVKGEDLTAFIEAGVKPGYFQELYPREHKSNNI